MLFPHLCYKSLRWIWHLADSGKGKNNSDKNSPFQLQTSWYSSSINHSLSHAFPLVHLYQIRISLYLILINRPFGINEIKLTKNQKSQGNNKDFEFCQLYSIKKTSNNKLLFRCLYEKSICVSVSKFQLSCHQILSNDSIRKTFCGKIKEIIGLP